MAAWRQGLRWLADRCAGQNIILAGDLNSTVDHYTGLGTDGGDLGRCHDAARASGDAAVGTWPAVVPQLLGAPIDHVLATSDWEVVGFRVIGSGRRGQRPPAGRRTAAPCLLKSCGIRSPRGTMDAMGNENRSTTPQSSTFKDFIFGDWAERPEPRHRSRAHRPPTRPNAARASPRCTRSSASSSRPARPKARSNDTDYPYRAHSAFSYLTAWGSDTVPGAVLVLEPTDERTRRHALSAPDGGPRLRGVLRERRDRRVLDRSAPEPRSTSHADLGHRRPPIRRFAAVLDATDGTTRIVREADRDLTDQIDGRRLLAAELPRCRGHRRRERATRCSPAT